MKLRYIIAIAAFCVCIVGSLGYSAFHYNTKYQDEKKRADGAEEQANNAQAITGNIIRAVNIINTISEANQNAKQQIALESQRTQADIKMAVAHDDCANRPVPAGAADRLRQYADTLRSGASSGAASQPDR